MRFSRRHIVGLVFGAAFFLGAANLSARYISPPIVREFLPDGWGGALLEREIETRIARVAVSDPTAAKIVAAAHAQKGDVYNAAYRKITFPGGDVPKGEGACTDVVVRALRGAGLDLQRLIHEDMKRDFGRYPKSWGLSRPDPNIDHRRVPNHMTFFKKWGQSLPTGLSRSDLSTFHPGDIVCWKMEDGRWHTGVVSDGVSARGLPLTIHNGWRCVEEDNLDRWEIVGHYRFPA